VELSTEWNLRAVEHVIRTGADALGRQSAGSLPARPHVLRCLTVLLAPPLAEKLNKPLALRGLGGYSSQFLLDLELLPETIRLLLDGTRSIGEHVIGVGPDQTNGANDNH